MLLGLSPSDQILMIKLLSGAVRDVPVTWTHH
jgi:hypothetical protein